MKGHLAELDKETLNALETLYNFSESRIRERREASSMSKYLKQFPLLKIEDLQKKIAMDLSTGHRRRIEASIVPGGSSMVNVNNPQDIVGFRLVSPLAMGRTFQGCPPPFSAIFLSPWGRESHVFNKAMHLDCGGRVTSGSSLNQATWMSLSD